MKIKKKVKHCRSGLGLKPDTGKIKTTLVLKTSGQIWKGNTVEGLNVKKSKSRREGGGKKTKQRGNSETTEKKKEKRSLD